jgi:hypothetical protein
MKGLARVTASMALAAVLLVGCGFGVQNYEQFRGAVDAGAPCEELYDIKSGFERASDRERIQRDLDEIGCDSPDSTRTDR